MLGLIIFVAIFFFITYILAGWIEKKLIASLKVEELNNFAELVAWFSALGMVSAFFGCLQLLIKVALFVLMLF